MTIEERAQLARSYFTSGYNCAQAVALAFCDVTGLDKETTAKALGGFGGGMGRMREVCGTVSGMVFVAGFLKPYTDISNPAAKKENYAFVQSLAATFKEENGSIICRVLLGGPDGASTDPTPAPRTENYYKKRPCVELVACAVRIIAAAL